MEVSQPTSLPPKVFGTPLQQRVYETLALLDMPFLRVDNSPAITMEDCRLIDERLQVQTVKTLFLCNRQQTQYYLFVTPGDKPFCTKDFSHAIGVSRLSFAPKEQLLPRLGTELGATTLFSMLLDSARDVPLYFDRQALQTEWYGCTDGTTTSYLKVRTDQLIQRFLPHAGRALQVVDV